MSVFVETKSGKAFEQRLERDRVFRLLSGDWTPADYSAYLRTDHWQETKAVALELWGAACCLCDSRNGVQVHHRPAGYKHLFNENPRKHLTVLCRRCHKRFHRR